MKALYFVSAALFLFTAHAEAKSMRQQLEDNKSFCAEWHQEPRRTECGMAFLVRSGKFDENLSLEQQYLEAYAAYSLYSSHVPLNGKQLVESATFLLETHGYFRSDKKADQKYAEAYALAAGKLGMNGATAKEWSQDFADSH